MGLSRLWPLPGPVPEGVWTRQQVRQQLGDASSLRVRAGAADEQVLFGWLQLAKGVVAFIG